MIRGADFLDFLILLWEIMLLVFCREIILYASCAALDKFFQFVMWFLFSEILIWSNKAISFTTTERMQPISTVKSPRKTPFRVFCSVLILGGLGWISMYGLCRSRLPEFFYQKILPKILFLLFNSMDCNVYTF